MISQRKGQRGEVAAVSAGGGPAIARCPPLSTTYQSYQRGGCRTPYVVACTPMPPATLCLYVCVCLYVLCLSLLVSCSVLPSVDVFSLVLDFEAVSASVSSLSCISHKPALRPPATVISQPHLSFLLSPTCIHYNKY